jgi:hypothetical protein
MYKFAFEVDAEACMCLCVGWSLKVFKLFNSSSKKNYYCVSSEFDQKL